MHDELRIGIIGTGIMGQDHARIIARGLAGSRLAAVADVDGPATEALAEELDVPHTFSDGSDLIESGLVDAVIVAAPDQFHARYTLDCIDHGLPVLCEKPLAPTVAEAVEVVRRGRASKDALVTIGFMRRFDPGYRALRHAVKHNDYGAVLMTHSVHRNVEAHPSGDSRATVTNSAVHEIDVLAWLCDSPIVEVLWAAGRPSSLITARHDPQLILMRDGNGILHTVELQMHAQYGYDVRCELACERGSVELPGTPALSEHRPLVAHTRLARLDGYPADWRPRFAAAYRSQLASWVSATLAGRLPDEAATMEQALQATVVADAVLASMSEGGWVAVPSLASVVS